ncbi:MAG: DUF4215 domain-containing protein [Polyangiales bacterium]
MASARLRLLAVIAGTSGFFAACSVYDPLLLPRPRDASPDANLGPGDAGMDVAVDSPSGADSAADVLADAGAAMDAMDSATEAAVDAARDSAPDARPDVVVSDGGCAAGQTNCGGTCVDLATSTMNCGACNNACPTVSNGAPRCQMGACVPLCTAPATPYDDRSCVIAASEACPTGTSVSWVTPNVTHVRFDNLTRTPAANVTLGGTCSSAVGPDSVFAFTSQLAATYSVELFSEAYDGVVAIRPAPCATTPGSETCANNSARAAREVASYATMVSASSPVYVISKARAASAGPFAIAVTASAPCTNRAINGSETCDDGNLVGSDGCSVTCSFSATTSASCTPPALYEPIRANVGTQRYRATPAVVADSFTLTCGTPATRDFVTFVTPAVSGRLEVRGGPNESVALFDVGTCAGRPIACAGLGVSSFASVTAGSTYALVVESPLRPLEFSLTLSRCGDGSIDGNEECDDGNLAAGDGCTAACARESTCSLTGAPSNTLAAPTRPRFSNCAVIPFSLNVGAVAVPSVSHATLVTLAAGDRVTASVSRTGGTALNPWGIEVLPESAAMTATIGTSCNATLSYACSSDAGATSNTVTWISPNGGNYFVRFFSQGVANSSLSGTVSVERYPVL